LSTFLFLRIFDFPSQLPPATEEAPSEERADDPAPSIDVVELLVDEVGLVVDPVADEDDDGDVMVVTAAEQCADD
jgi:hypothetical protein